MYTYCNWDFVFDVVKSILDLQLRSGTVEDLSRNRSAVPSRKQNYNSISVYVYTIPGDLQCAWNCMFDVVKRSLDLQLRFGAVENK